jgi:hypothetical protein
MKKKKLVLKKKPDAGENLKDAPAVVAALKIEHTTPIPSGPIRPKKSEVQVEKSKDDESDRSAAAAAKLQRERDEAAISKREGGNAGGSGKRGAWDFIDDFPGF